MAWKRGTFRVVAESNVLVERLLQMLKTAVGEQIGKALTAASAQDNSLPCRRGVLLYAILWERVAEPIFRHACRQGESTAGGRQLSISGSLTRFLASWPA